MADPITENPIIIDLSKTFGCIFIGILLSCAVWGITTLQAFLYFSRYRTKSDGWGKPALVILLWLINTANEAMVIQAIWATLIPRFGSVANLGEARPTTDGWHNLSLYQSNFSSFIEFTCTRSVNGKKWAVPLVLATISIYQLIIIIPYDVYVYGTGATMDTLESRKAIAMVLALRSVTAADDILIAGCMMYYVLRQGISEYRDTRRVIFRLLVVTVNTGFWTAVFALTELCLVARFPTGLQFMVVEGPLCSLYLSTLLACLNTRQYIKDGRVQGTGWSQTPSGLAVKAGSRGEAPLLLRSFGSDNQSAAGMDKSSRVIKIETSESQTVVYHEPDFSVKRSQTLTDDQV